MVRTDDIPLQFRSGRAYPETFPPTDYEARNPGVNPSAQVTATPPIQHSCGGKLEEYINKLNRFNYLSSQRGGVQPVEIWVAHTQLCRSPKAQPFSNSSKIPSLCLRIHKGPIQQCFVCYHNHKAVQTQR
jgi:hypothetical protein